MRLGRGAMFTDFFGKFLINRLELGRVTERRLIEFSVEHEGSLLGWHAFLLTLFH
jgi:hypothetical protein